MESNDYVVFAERSTSLRADALDIIDANLRDESSLVLAYANESWDEEGSSIPFRSWKPRWSPERLRGQDFVGYPVIVSKDLLAVIGGIRPELGSLALYDLVLRASEHATSVVNIPDVLHHSDRPRRPSGDNSAAALALRERIVQEHLDRCGIAAQATTISGFQTRIDRVLREQPLVSIIIPTACTVKRVWGRDTNLVTNCVRSVIDRSSYKNIEILVVHDRLLDPETASELRVIAGDRVRFLPFSGPFNFSEKVNQGALKARGDVLLLLNDDTEVRSPNWMEVMLGVLEDPGVGIVGPKLLLADGRIQSAGHFFTNGAMHVAAGYSSDELGSEYELSVAAERSGITMACAAVRRDVFMSVGGLCVDLPRAYNDVDFCNKLELVGLRCIWTPWAEVHHFESLSRDPTVTADEVNRISERWGVLIQSPDCFLPHFDLRLAGINYVAEDTATFGPGTAPSSQTRLPT
jgi:O-antigen biosynthesis protein